MRLLTRMALWGGTGAVVPIPLVATWHVGPYWAWKVNAALAAVFWPGGSTLYAIFVLDRSAAPVSTLTRWDLWTLAQLGLVNATVYALCALTLTLLSRRSPWWLAAAIVPALFVAIAGSHLQGIAASF